MRLSRGGFALMGLIALVVIVAPSSSPTIFIVLACFLSLLILNIPYAILSVRGLSILRNHPTHVREYIWKLPFLM